MFAAAARGTAAALAGTGQACGTAASLLGDLAVAVRRTEDELAALGAQHRALPAHLMTPGIDLTGPAGDAQRRADVLSGQAHEATSELKRVERRIAGEMNALTDRLVPRLAGLPSCALVRKIHPGTGGGGGLAGALSTLTAALLVGPDGALTPVPDPTASPGAVHRWWTGLTTAQRDALVRADPRHWGNLDGIPVLDRDLANRIVLPQEIRDLRAELQQRFPEGEPGRYRTTYLGYGTGEVRTENPAWTAWDDLNQRLAGAASIDQRLHHGYLLIGFQPYAGSGRAIVSQGDPDTAAHTSIFVPGTTARLGSIDGDIERSDVMGGSASRSGAGSGTFAHVTWLGYDAPPTVLGDAPHLGWAEKGAPLLDGFASGLRATHAAGGRSHVTVVGHSYAATVIGQAASHGHRLEVDDVLMVAAAGAGVGHGWLGDDGTTVDDLHLSGPSRGHVYATRSRSDPIRWANDTHLGVDPTRATFGATVFGASPGTTHDGYWKDDTAALRSMGLVIAGRGPDVPPPTDDQRLGDPADVTFAPGS
ncbi:alpha/beta hydrolase [Marmoricola endophyticus]|uniref:alpha/beta hydrolase n=1 Tax=Marmoricola endophyticus TaxID=2040280 RepID=UPI00166DEDBB|nr:alpha/beta hydrolase [Marmoricola endophyticus]